MCTVVVTSRGCFTRELGQHFQMACDLNAIKHDEAGFVELIIEILAAADNNNARGERTYS